MKKPPGGLPFAVAASEKKRTGTAKGNKKPAGQKLAGMKKPPGGGFVGLLSSTVRFSRMVISVFIFFDF